MADELPNEGGSGKGREAKAAAVESLAYFAAVGVIAAVTVKAPILIVGFFAGWTAFKHRSAIAAKASGFWKRVKDAAANRGA